MSKLHIVLYGNDLFKSCQCKMYQENCIGVNVLSFGNG